MQSATVWRKRAPLGQLTIARRPTDEQLDRAAQEMANAMHGFIQRHPTQWFHFVEEPQGGKSEAGSAGR